MMYHLFAGDFFYPKAYCEDYRGSWKTIEEAKSAKILDWWLSPDEAEAEDYKTISGLDWWIIYQQDPVTGKLVEVDRGKGYDS